MVGILLTNEKHLHDLFISLVGWLGSKKLTYTLHIFIELSVSIQENERLCI